MSRSQLSRDIERNLVEKFQDLIQREIQIAHTMLGQEEAALLLVLVAKGTLGTAAATIAGMTKPDANPGEVFDMVIEQVVTLIRKDRNQALEKVAAVRTRYAESAR